MLLLMPFISAAQTFSDVNVQYICTDRKENVCPVSNQLETDFKNISAAEKYVKQLPELFLKKGYPAASVDSIRKTDSLLVVYLYVGPVCKSVQLRLSEHTEWTNEGGWPQRNNNIVSVDFFQFLSLRDRVVDYYQNHGYPFATVSLDSAQWDSTVLNASLQVEKGIFYPIDSISVAGNVKIKNEFLQRYLGIMNRSGYNKKNLIQVDKKLTELDFMTPLQPSTLTMLGTGATLNLFLKNKKTNQVNFLLGIMPSSQNAQKTLITGDINLNLKNMLSAGERIVFKWQQLQPRSPRLTLGFNRPYILHSAFGFDFNFDMFKKDSNFLQINSRIGCQFEMKKGITGKLFLQLQQNSLLPGGTDTLLVKSTKQLPDNADMSASALGISFIQNSIDFKQNPRRGNEIDFTGTAGLKKIKKNNDILNLSETGFDFDSLYDSIRLNTYQIRCKFSAAHFFPVGKNATCKTSLSSGLYYSPDIFRNDLYQIGGAALLRGFDEESIYATTYVVLSAEYRQLFGTSSFLSFFTDYGHTTFRYQATNQKNNYFGAGVGLQFQTKGGLLNVSYAAGKTGGLPFNINQSSKIHFGYVNYF